VPRALPVDAVPLDNTTDDLSWFGLSRPQMLVIVAAEIVLFASVALAIEFVASTSDSTTVAEAVSIPELPAPSATDPSRGNETPSAKPAILTPATIEKKPVKKPPAKPSGERQPNGFGLYRPLDCQKHVEVANIAPSFNLAKSWRLSLEFEAKKFEKGSHQLLFWGDDRPGCDPIYLRLENNNLEAGIGDAKNNKTKTIRAPLESSHLDRFVAVRLVYVAKGQAMALFVDGKQIKRLKCNFTPSTDRPMPLCLGGATADAQRFTGKLRHIWLGNEEPSGK
jgi:hypothetical protein